MKPGRDAPRLHHSASSEGQCVMASWAWRFACSQPLIHMARAASCWSVNSSSSLGSLRGLECWALHAGHFWPSGPNGQSKIELQHCFASSGGGTGSDWPGPGSPGGGADTGAQALASAKDAAARRLMNIRWVNMVVHLSSRVHSNNVRLRDGRLANRLRSD